MSKWISLLLIITFAGSVFSQEPNSTETWLKRWRTGYHPVAMSHMVRNVEMIRLANINGKLVSAEPQPDAVKKIKDDGLPIYLYVFDGDGVLHLKDFFTTVRKQYAETRDPNLLKREPSLFDPAVRAALKERLNAFFAGYAGCDIMAACVAHEASLTSFSLPFDYDRSELALTAFREWLKKKYNSIESLNETWKTHYASFDALVPLTTEEMLSREKNRAPAMNLAPWFDFRAFNDEAFMNLIDELALHSLSVSPNTPVSATVTAMPSGWGGWDYGRLTSGHIPLIETYPFPGDFALVHGLSDGQTVQVSSCYTDQGDAMMLEMQRNFFYGERGNFFVGSFSKVFPEPNQLGGISAQYAPEFKKMNEYAIVLNNAKLEDGGVRMIYSQPSIRCSWFIDNLPDGNTYINRGSKYEIDHNTWIQSFSGWIDCLGELGVHPLIEPSENLESRQWRHGQPETILALRLCSVSPAEMESLNQFVQSGGTLIVDETFGMFDGNGNAANPDVIPLLAEPRPPLRSSFGELKTPSPISSEPVVKNIGAGKIVMLNAEYARFASIKDAAVRRELLSRILPYIQEPGISVLDETGQPAIDIDIFLFKKYNRRYLGLCPTRPDAARRVDIVVGLRHNTLQSIGSAPCVSKSIGVWTADLPSCRSVLFEID